MRKKGLFTFTALFIGVMLVLGGNAAAQSNSNDTWSDVARLNQLNGTWKGLSSSTQTMRQFMESQGIAWTPEIQQFYGDMNVKVDLDLAMNINTGKLTGSINGKIIFTFSGGNINNTWSSLRDALSGEGAVVDDAKYSLASPINVSDSMTESELREYKINQNGRKIRVNFSKLGLSFLPEYFVFNKA
jgi:hypothetical protein